MNTVVFAVRDCSVGGLGPYGNEWVATPHLDRLAAGAVVFDRHTCDSPDPAAARRAWRTGASQTPRRDGTAPPAPAGPDLLARLAQAGVRTVLVDATRTGQGPEFYAGFAERFACPPAAGDATPTAALLRTLPAVAESVRGAAGYLVWVELDRLSPPWDVPQDVFDAYIEDVFDQTPDDPASRESTLDAEEVLTADEDIVVIDPNAAEYFEEVDDEDDEPARPVAPAAPVVLPLAGPPSGWFDRADAPQWEYLHRSFAAAVTTFDAGMGKVFAALAELDFGGAAWVLTADRGQPLGEHGACGDFRPFLHEELVHVPLIVRLPNAAGEGRRVAGLTVPADLMPTLLDLHDLPAPDGIDGVSLRPQLDGALTTARPAVVSGLVTPTASEWAVRTARWAYLVPGRAPEGDPPRGPRLYVKPEDRYEVNDVLAEHPDAAAELDALLAAAAGEA